jgi:hypothetical protein
MRVWGWVVLVFAFGALARGQQLALFPQSELRANRSPLFEARESSSPHLDDLEHSPPWEREENAGFRLDRVRLSGPERSASDSEPEIADADDLPPAERRCVLFQCEPLPVQPAKKLFNTGVTLWTIVGVLGGAIDGALGPINHGLHPFEFESHSYFAHWQYSGGANMVSHFISSAGATDLAYDAYRLNGLTEDQSFALAFGTIAVAGALVEVGDGLTTPNGQGHGETFGFSPQDWVSGALGALSQAIIKRSHADDLLSFQLGVLPVTEIPPAIVGGRPLFGIDYSQEMYSLSMHSAGLFRRLHSDPGIARFVQFSFAYMTKGFGYYPPLDSRYQQVGWEIGLDFPEILRAVGVSNSTWWGDFLLRAFTFIRIPYTQVGVYYNLTTGKWYGPGAPYHYIP